jgi:hypothetical protein
MSDDVVWTFSRYFGNYFVFNSEKPKSQKELISFRLRLRLATTNVRSIAKDEENFDEEKMHLLRFYPLYFILVFKRRIL